MDTTSTAKKDIQDHLRRVSDLGVTPEEYAEAYDVDLEQLRSAKHHSAGVLSDFVPVTVVDTTPASNGVVCRLVHADGWSLECQQWPPASWLRSLGSVS